MKVDKFGRVSVSEQEGIDNLYSKKIANLSNLFFDEETVSKFNHALEINRDEFSILKSLGDQDETLEFFDEANQSEWFMSDEYRDFPIHQWLIDQCNSPDELERVDKELELFIQHGMFDLLYYLKYLVDTMRQNKIVWGVGRGSSVASYVLYLLGVHKINSIKYQLDINEFLK